MAVLRDGDTGARAALDGRVAFAVVASFALILLLMLLDRVGVPERLVVLLGPLLALLGLGLLGVSLRSMQVSRFYAAGRAIPARYAGLALAALFSGLFLPFLPPTSVGVSFGTLAAGGAGGVALVCLVCGPLVRKTGAFSLADLLTARFPNLALRLAIVVVVTVTSVMVSLAALETAVGVLAHTLHLSRVVALVLGALVIGTILVPGGAGGFVWAAAAAAGLMLAGFVLPLALAWATGAPAASALGGDVQLWTNSLAQLQAWSVQSGMAKGLPFSPAIAGVIALGIGVLVPLLAPAMATSNRVGAQRAGLVTCLWMVALVGLVGLTLVGALSAMQGGVVGVAPSAVPPEVLEASAQGLVSICGKLVDSAAAAKAACASLPGFRGVLRLSDVGVSAAFLLQGVPVLGHMGMALVGLTATGLVAVLLALAAAGLHALSVAIGHDTLYRVRDATALTSHRLATTRAVQVVILLGVVVLLLRHPVDPKALIGMAVAFSATAFVPLLALTLWPRASGPDATLSLLVSLGTAEVVIVLAGTQPSIDHLALAAGLGCGLGLLVGLATSFLRPPDSTSPGKLFVTRLWHGTNDVLNLDKGA